jgi:hypothetical protein
MISNTSWAYICHYNTFILLYNQVNQSLRDSRAQEEFQLLLKKTEDPVKRMEYFGLTSHTESMSVKIPEETIKEFLKKLTENSLSLSKDMYFPIQQDSASKPISFYNRHHTPTLSV